MRFPSGTSAVVVLAGLVLPAGLLGSCGSSSNCAGVADSATFTGKVVAEQGNGATFLVESGSPDMAAGAPAIGRVVSVRYPAGEVRSLRVGDTYRVPVTADGATLVSEINHACSAGTTWPDGSYVRTGSWWHRNRTLLPVLLLPVGVAVIAAAGGLAGRRRRVRSSTLPAPDSGTPSDRSKRRDRGRARPA